jgi:hypothetical protein
MQKVLTNQFKRQDVFRCSFKSHFKFENNVSVYHVLKEKNCYPSGCVYFVWKCKFLNKGESCPKGFSHVGRKCFGCPHYFEEKLSFQPEIVLEREKFEDFQRDLEDFEYWLETVLGKEVEFSGTINSVKPNLTKIMDKDKEIFLLKGFLLNFREGYLGRVFFDDFIYVRISKKLQEKYQFSSKDKLEFKGILSLNKGRIVLQKVRQIEILEKINLAVWNLSNSLVAKNTGTEFDCQPEKCLACEKGVLVDVSEKRGFDEKRYRHLFCLAGMENPGICVYQLYKKMERAKTKESRE